MFVFYMTARNNTVLNGASLYTEN